jgi:hypothetical protein
VLEVLLWFEALSCGFYFLMKIIINKKKNRILFVNWVGSGLPNWTRLF